MPPVAASRMYLAAVEGSDGGKHGGRQRKHVCLVRRSPIPLVVTGYPICCGGAMAMGLVKAPTAQLDTA